MKLSTGSRKVRMNKILTTCLAVVATVSVAACSSSKGGGGPKPAPQVGAAASPTPAPYKYSASGGDELNGDSSDSSQYTPQPEGDVTFSGDDSGPASGPAADAGTTTHVKPRPRSGTRRPRPGVTPVAPTRTQPSASSGDMVDANGTPLYYSSASSDNLRARIEAIAPRTRGDLAWANELAKGKLLFTIPTGDVLVNILETRPDGQQFKITLQGRVDVTGRGGLPDPGTGISGAIECLDVNQGCETAHVKIYNANYNPVRVAHMIIRTQNAHVRITGKGFGISHNLEYDWLMQILLNSETHKTTFGYIKRLVVASSETIFGESNVAVGMDILNQDRVEFVDFYGPLVRYANSSVVNVPMTQTSVNPAGYQQLIANTLSDIRMVSNTGRGEVTMALTVRAANPGSVEDTATLKMTRIQNAIKSPTSL